MHILHTQYVVVFGCPEVVNIRMTASLDSKLRLSGFICRFTLSHMDSGNVCDNVCPLADIYCKHVTRFNMVTA